MEAIYVDLHIHTSEDANSLNKSYDVVTLFKKVKSFSKNKKALISLTDHNVINKDAYLRMKEINDDEVSFLVGVELSIRNYSTAPFYHCHLFFNIDKNSRNLESEIDRLNKIFDDLYPNKMVSNTEDVPTLQDILNKLENIDVLTLPHGGQSHRTFDVSIPKNVTFDSVMERSVYYNAFDGFTSRSNDGLENTKEYFKKLGIDAFINLITCTDNYEIDKYPFGKSDKINFIPTWMYANPDFHGLRVALSESERLSYGDFPFDGFQEYIQKVELHETNIDIDVKLENGLNVVIGNSSSGKTLFVDSIYRKLTNTIGESVYNEDYSVQNLVISNPSSMIPHYFSQNYIMSIINAKKGLENIEIVKSVFPLDKDVEESSKNNLYKIKKDIDNLIDCVKAIEALHNELRTISAFPRLIILGDLPINPINNFIPNLEEEKKLQYTKIKYDEHVRKLDEIISEYNNLAFHADISNEVKILKDKLLETYTEISFENSLREIIKNKKNFYDNEISQKSSEKIAKTKNKNKLIIAIGNYKNQLDIFYSTLSKLAAYNFSITTNEINSSGHKLFIENNLKLNKDIILNALNYCLLNPLTDFEHITPANLFSNWFKSKPSISNYEVFKAKTFEQISKNNITKYKILYEGSKDFDELSPGLKSSIILDLIINYEKDNAPLIIDQPEDNLATSYINKGLLIALKKAKKRRQIIIVTHIATIPMLGDAQNMIICNNHDKKISISSAKLEEKWHDIPVTDVIARITDGGKSSVKKRFKKYNLKNFRGEAK